MESYTCKKHKVDGLQETSSARPANALLACFRGAHYWYANPSPPELPPFELVSFRGQEAVIARLPKKTIRRVTATYRGLGYDLYIPV